MPLLVEVQGPQGGSGAAPRPHGGCREAKHASPGTGPGTAGSGAAPPWGV